ncbi:hypothetical protein [Arthrobacter sp. FW306-2-2C-D06B]|uniref:hypothetical protein n=1 Tax=Arthrobacter sp. FW306-2-2C-D06B TaxID=2879618 RepID=UPI001F3B7FFD|nr:hypothetical protein [Arthrobacter sp. FW306-2-2C-D06B]UKA59777.1 hypothetical protein LFT47_05385 [Arthrobacter sp. FW306-2-2C-D06B]
MLVFKPVDSSQLGVHTFACYDLESDEVLIEEIAALVRDLYVEDVILGEQLRTASQSLDEVCDEAEICALVDRVAMAVIPQMNTGSSQPLHLQVPRNEVAEVLAIRVLQQIHGFSVPSSRIRNKEVAGSPSRGLDVLGLTQSMGIALTEVKASSSTQSPPTVVHGAADSMRAETLKRLNDRDSLIAELHWALKHAKPESRLDVAKSLFLHARQTPPVSTVAPVLVRPAGAYQATDYGNFKEPSIDFGDSPIKFVVVRLPGTLEDFAGLVYAKAAEQAA